MPAYTSPSPQEIQEATGINIYALGLTQRELDASLSNFIEKAEADIAGQVTDAVFDSTGLTDRQVTRLRDAVSQVVAARFLRVVQLREASGTLEPLVLPGGRSTREAIEDLKDEAGRLASLVGNGEGTVEKQVLHPFTSEIPERTFTRAMQW